jgi:hypothetical protein
LPAGAETVLNATLQHYARQRVSTTWHRPSVSNNEQYKAQKRSRNQYVPL